MCQTPERIHVEATRRYPHAKEVDGLKKTHQRRKTTARASTSDISHAGKACHKKPKAKS